MLRILNQNWNFQCLYKISYKLNKSSELNQQVVNRKFIVKFKKLQFFVYISLLYAKNGNNYFFTALLPIKKFRILSENR